MVDQVVGLLVHLESITFREAGRIGRVEPSTEAPSKLPNKLGLLGSTSPSNSITEVEISGFGVGVGEPKAPTRSTRFLLDLLNEQLASWIAHEMKQFQERAAFTTDKFKRLQNVVQEMVTLGFLNIDYLPRRMGRNLGTSCFIATWNQGTSSFPQAQKLSRRGASKDGKQARSSTGMTP